MLPHPEVIRYFSTALLLFVLCGSAIPGPRFSRPAR